MISQPAKEPKKEHNGFRSDIFCAGMLYLKMRLNCFPQDYMDKNKTFFSTLGKCCKLKIKNHKSRLFGSYCEVVNFWRWFYSVPDPLEEYFSRQRVSATKDEKSFLNLIFKQSPSFYADNSANYFLNSVFLKGV